MDADWALCTQRAAQTGPRTLVIDRNHFPIFHPSNPCSLHIFVFLCIEFHQLRQVGATFASDDIVR